MDGRPPQPPEYYEHNNWPVDGQGSDEGLHMPFNILSNSQTQLLEDLIGNTTNFVSHHDENTYVNQHVPSYSDAPQQPIMLNNLMTTDTAYNPIHTTVHEEQNFSAPLMNALSSNLHEIPAMEMWPGPHNFMVEFSQAQDKTKATPWIFSNKLKKLYVSMDKACPIFFRLDALPHLFSNYCIRGQVVYSKADHYHDNVERCINHQRKDPPTAFSAHLLRCDDSSSQYMEHQDKRHSVVVPLKPPAPGTQSVTLCFRFMCLSSCIGSLNRRPTKLIFTLENLNGQAEGRYVCDVRICSCPGRDIRADEGKEEKKSSDQTIEESNPANIRIELPYVGFPKGKTKKRKAVTNPPSHTDTVENDDTIYTMDVNFQIRGRRQYELVRDMINTIMLHCENTSRINSQTDSNEVEKRFKTEQP